MKSAYSLIIQWSDEDEVYIAKLPEFGSALTHGSSYEEAARMGHELLETLIDIYVTDGKPLPEPDRFIYEEARVPASV